MSCVTVCVLMVIGAFVTLAIADFLDTIAETFPASVSERKQSQL